jgi:hypothetical protein
VSFWADGLRFWVMRLRSLFWETQTRTRSEGEAERSFPTQNNSEASEEAEPPYLESSDQAALLVYSW